MKHQHQVGRDGEPPRAPGNRSGSSEALPTLPNGETQKKAGLPFPEQVPWDNARKRSQ